MGLFFYPISVILLRNVVMKMIKFAICDDEPVMAQEITNQLSQYMLEKGLTSYCVNSFSNGRSLLENGCDFDVIFLDIQMEYLNGMETAKMLRQRKNHSILIFVTVLKEYVFDAFEVEAFDYLIKPLDSGHFKRTMDRVIISLQSKEAKSIVIQRGTSCEVILLEQILYCEVQGRKIYIHKNDGKSLTTMRSWKIWNSALTGGFSGVTEVISSILSMSADAMPDRSCCHRAIKSLFPDCVSEI